MLLRRGFIASCVYWRFLQWSAHGSQTGHEGSCPKGQHAKTGKNYCNQIVDFSRSDTAKHTTLKNRNTLEHTIPTYISSLSCQLSSWKTSRLNYWKKQHVRKKCLIWVSTQEILSENLAHIQESDASLENIFWVTFQEHHLLKQNIKPIRNVFDLRWNNNGFISHIRQICAKSAKKELGWVRN